VDTAAPAPVPDYHRGVVSDSSAPTAGRSAAAILAGAAAGSHLAGAAADAWFLAAVGPGRLGLAVAGSSLLVALMVAVVGGLADRRDRRRTLVALAAGGALALAAIAALHQAAPRATAVFAFVCVKQLQAAVELAFWVAVSEWFDARTLRRLVPRLAAASGVGGLIGAALVAPIARVAGTGVLFASGAAAFALVAAVAARTPTTRRVGAALGGRARGSWADSLAALQRQPLARGLAGLVAIAGVAASLTYVALGAAAAAHHAGDARGLAAFLGAVRMSGQLAMIAAQVLIAPKLLARLGVGGALVVAPVTACLGAVGVLASGSLTAAALLQIQARITDGAIEGPAEKLAQNLLPIELRGRLGGWLEGPAKRTGAIVGGLAAGAVAADRLGGLVLVTALAWLAIALVVRARLPRWALGALARPAGGDEPVALGGRAARQVVQSLAVGDPARAAEVAVRLHRDGFDARPLLCDLYRDAPAARAAVLDALARTAAPRARDRVTADALARAPDARDDVERARLALIGRLARGRAVAIVGAPRPGTAAAWALAAARAEDDAAAIAAALEDAIDDDDPAVAHAGVAELTREVADRAAATPPAGFALARLLLRLVRRRDGLPDATVAAAIAALAALATAGPDDAEARWLRADVGELVRSLAAPGGGGAPLATGAALTALARWPDGPGPDDLALIADALGARDDEIRQAAEAALRGLGPAAVVALVRTAGLGRRGARDRAVALLGELAVDVRELARVVTAELDALDRLAVDAGALSALGDPLLDRRLDERLREVAHTALLLVAAQARSGAVARAARAVRAATTIGERARAVEILDATLPRAIAARVVPMLDPGALAARVHGARARRGPVALDAAITAELTGGDRLTRDLLLRALPPARRREFKGVLTSAAHAAAAAISPLDLLRRVTADVDDDDVSAIDVLLVLAEVPALAGLSTPQLAAVADRGDVLTLAPGAAVASDGERLDALLVVLDGAIAAGDRRVTRGQAVDELAAIAPRPTARIAALEPTRLFRLRRLDLDELIDDEPGLGSALVRYLGEALRAR
jgi:hypothetical protein